MKAIAGDQETITIQFTRNEAERIRSAVNYVADLFEEIDREALDGYLMTEEEAEEIADTLTVITTAQRTPVLTPVQR